MGIWGTSLYSNDTASDIRGDYVDQLRRGNTNEAATQVLIENNRGSLADEEEAPLFWFALADTQWNYGRLLPQVKEQAIRFLENRDAELQRWEDSGDKRLSDAWNRTLDALQEKLNKPQPPEKKVYRYRLYQCKWALGDVFAYCFTSEYSKEQGFYGQYVIFRKKSETYAYPGHIVPVIEVYCWIGKEIPPLFEIYNKPIMPTMRKPPYSGDNRFLYEMMSTSERVIPKKNLTWLENRPGNDLIPYNGNRNMLFNEVVLCGWEGAKCNHTFEHDVIDMYIACCKYLEEHPGTEL